MGIQEQRFPVSCLLNQAMYFCRRSIPKRRLPSAIQSKNWRSIQVKSVVTADHGTLVDFFIKHDKPKELKMSYQQQKGPRFLCNPEWSQHTHIYIIIYNIWFKYRFMCILYVMPSGGWWAGSCSTISRSEFPEDLKTTSGWVRIPDLWYFHLEVEDSTF